MALKVGLLLALVACATAFEFIIPDEMLEAFEAEEAEIANLRFMEDGKWMEPAGSYERIEISHAGLDRVYVLYTPPNLPANSSLVLIPHYAWGSPLMAEMFARMAVASDSYNYAVAFPRGIDRTFYAGPVCCGGAPERDDIGLMRAIVNDVYERIEINRRRVYSAGLSNGGYMSYALACNASDLVAAIAPIAANSPWLDFLANCHPSRPVPVFHMHGTTDPLVPFDMGRNVFELMLGLNGCDPSQSELSLVNGVTTCESWTSCGGHNVNMTFCGAEGVGHRYWPGSPSVFTVKNYDLEGSMQILEFFNKFQIE